MFLQTVQHYEAIEASEGRMREQMNALQRKLVRVVTENEALRHVVDKLQCNVLSLRRQLQRAGMALDAELDEALLRPSPHQVQPAAVLVVAPA
jgi:predicted  nucleic acid-binding Zn-ribbon protein